MTKREQVVVTICGILSVAAAIYYLSSGVTSSSVSKKNFSVAGHQPIPVGSGSPAMIAKKLEYEVAIIRKARSDDSKDPFMNRSYSANQVHTLEIKPTVKASSGKPKAVYSGYIYQKEGSFAIINGVDYRVGEKLKGSNYLIQSITGAEVVLVEDFQERTREPKTIKLAIQSGNF